MERDLIKDLVRQERVAFLLQQPTQRHNSWMPETLQNVSFTTAFLLAREEPSRSISEPDLLDLIFTRGTAIFFQGNLFLAKQILSKSLGDSMKTLRRNKVEKVLSINKPGSAFAAELLALKGNKTFLEHEIRYLELKP